MDSGSGTGTAPPAASSVEVLEASSSLRLYALNLSVKEAVVDEQRTAREHDAQAKRKLEEAEQPGRLQDLDVTKEAGEKITGGVPRLGNSGGPGGGSEGG